MYCMVKRPCLNEGDTNRYSFKKVMKLKHIFPCVTVLQLKDDPMDQKLGSWSLGVLIDNGIFEPIVLAIIPFHPPNRICRKSGVEGEIVNKHAFCRHTSTQMGSGCYPAVELTKWHTCISLSENDFQPVQDLELLVTRHGYYSSKMLNDTFFYHGGPDHLKSIAVQLTVDYILIYFGFVLFLFV
ncbi:hypothetical protein HID58_064488 [Brassica napus]|uniref:Neprosin PEP catalytic domain-containing protein n=1 Tax=Brassica napus TaxID=3708 RepID=A0ABQ7ZA47_BRANA|nr:hypothetical protein HID58_064488 [Brassica napus]